MKRFANKRTQIGIYKKRAFSVPHSCPTADTIYPIYSQPIKEAISPWNCKQLLACTLPLLWLRHLLNSASRRPWLNAAAATERLSLDALPIRIVLQLDPVLAALHAVRSKFCVHDWDSNLIWCRKTGPELARTTMLSSSLSIWAEDMQMGREIKRWILYLKIGYCNFMISLAQLDVGLIVLELVDHDEYRLCQ